MLWLWLVIQNCQMALHEKKSAHLPVWYRLFQISVITQIIVNVILNCNQTEDTHLKCNLV